MQKVTALYSRSARDNQQSIIRKQYWSSTVKTMILLILSIISIIMKVVRR